MIANSLGDTLSPTLCKQLKQLYATLLSPTGHLTVNLVDCAQQPNLQDCGLFAAAFLFEWVTESVNTPLRINFTLSEIRSHRTLPCA